MMESSNNPVLRLRAQIASLEDLLADLKTQLTHAETRYNHEIGTQVPLQPQYASLPPVQPGDYREKTFESLVDHEDTSQKAQWRRSCELTPDEHKRYGRQLIMPEIGLRGQLRLKNASVLIVGVGGLGCPAATYLAGAGVGEIGLMDGDTVELSNLHRQLLHSERWLGMSKVDSAVENLRGRNSENRYVAHNHNLNQKIAVEVMRNYDLILDCTDRPSTRYLVSDAAVLAEKSVVTASALRTEGQLMVLNNPPRNRNHPGRFCYRCVFPKPPPAESVLSCGEGGILGPVVGVMGVLMAMEALKILLRFNSEDTHEELPTGSEHPAPPSLLLYSAYSNPPFRSIKLRGQRKGCPSCSDTATITEELFQSTSSSDYHDAFCAAASASPTATITTNRISATEYSHVRDAAAAADRPPQHVLVDVRERVQFDICHLKGSVNLPFSEISRDPQASIDRLDRTIIHHRHHNNNNSRSSDGVTNDYEGVVPLYLICRYGNDSQLAANALKDLTGFRPKAAYELRGDIVGGLRAWREEVDPGFPEY